MSGPALLGLAGRELPSLIHQTACISLYALVGIGTAVLPRTVIDVGCKTGREYSINCGTNIGHGRVLEDGGHICIRLVVKEDNHLPLLHGSGSRKGYLNRMIKQP